MFPVVRCLEGGAAVVDGLSNGIAADDLVRQILERSVPDMADTLVIENRYALETFIGKYGLEKSERLRVHVATFLCKQDARTV